MAALRLLAVAVTQRRFGYVFLINGQLKEWQLMTKPTKSRSNAAGALQELINNFKPDVVVTEDIDAGSKKGKGARTITQALQHISSQNYVLDVCVKRVQNFANKYEEAVSLAGQYPVIKPLVPEKRRFFDSEPARMVLFDALALAHAVLQRPSTTLAAAM